MDAQDAINLAQQAMLTALLISAPILLGVGLLLLGWAYFAAGGFGPMLSARSQFRNTGDFLNASSIRSM